MSATDDLPGRNAARKVVLLAAMMLAVSLILSGFAAVKIFESAIEPEIEKRANLIGRSVRSEVENALQIGIPFNALAGVERYLSEVMQDFSEIERITLIDVDKVIVADVSRNPASRLSGGERMEVVTGTDNVIVSPMLNGNTLVGEIVLQIDENFVTSKMRNILLDVLVLGLVAVLLSCEFVNRTVTKTIGKPLDRVFIVLNEQASGIFRHIIKAETAGTLMRIARRLSDRACDLAERNGTTSQLAFIQKSYFSDVRLPLFLFSTATEISTAFLPIFARDADRPAWLSDEMAATSPLVAYLLAMALIFPFSGWISRRIGARNLFLLSVPLTAVALIGVGLGFSVISISLWHGIMALLYALATVACQDYSLGAASRGENAQALGGYMFVVLGGVFCGAALGGVLADRIGFFATFGFAAVLAVFSAIMGYFAMSPKVGADPGRGPVAAVANARRAGSILASPRFLSLLVSVSASKNVAFSVFVWYITPLALDAEGASFADMGRVVMIYYLVPLFVLPKIAKLADTRIGCVPFLIAGQLVSGLALTSLFFWSGFWPVAIAVTFLGLGHAIIDATHYPQAIRIADQSGFRNARLLGMSALRLVERLSAIAGLIIAAVFLKQAGYVQVTVWIGVLAFGSAALVAVTEFGLRTRRA